MCPVGLPLGAHKQLNHLSIWEISNSLSMLWIHWWTLLLWDCLRTVSSNRCSNFKSSVCFSRPTALPDFSLSVFSKLFKILLTLQSPHFNFLNVCLDIMLSWWITNAFPESLNALYLWKLSSFMSRLDRIPSRWPVFLNHSTREKKAILLQLVNGHSHVQFVIHNTEVLVM